jgi:thiamine biosynthesis lipoprotein
MGTWVALHAEADSDALAIAGVEAAFAAVRRVEARMHPTRAGSDLAAIHAAPAGEPVRVDDWTWEVLALAQHLARLSDGVFDPCLPAAPGRIADLDTATPGVAVRMADLRLDLGGIAKGYAVDKAVEAMKTAGCTHGIVNAGGDLRVFGEPQAVIVRAQGGSPFWLVLGNEALAVSDPRSESRPPEHAGYYLRGCLRLPASMRPAAVVARSAALADALTKCALLAPPAFSRDLCDSFGAAILDVPMQ